MTALALALAALGIPLDAPSQRPAVEDRLLRRHAPEYRLLRRHAPEYRLDRAETSPPASVRDAARDTPALRPLVAGEPGGPRVYARAVPASRGRTYLQYWTFHRDNPQDRGLVRTGRHAGDWELVQVRLDRGRPASATYFQHSWAERCGWGELQRRGTHPLVHVANGSHAAYFTRGTHGRPWPDPDDEARDGGRILRPPVRPIDAESPPWMRYRGRWGPSRAAAIPGEHSSPHGPAFQPDRWNDPAALERGARPCGAGAPGRPWQIVLEAVLAASALAAVATAIRQRRRRRAP